MESKASTILTLVVLPLATAGLGGGLGSYLTYRTPTARWT